ncbi:MAG: response regulator transcription factor [Alphaproteobacteria bacterium]|nr:response regulator transcription factor [Alphaproteobacteria bacterium]
MKILIADDHSLFRDGVKLHVENLEPSAKILEASNYNEATSKVSSTQDLDLILLDLSMPGENWKTELDKIMKVASDKTKVVVLSASEDLRDIHEALDMGVSGYIPKRSSTKVLIGAIKLVMDDGQYLPPAILHSSTDKKQTSIYPKENKSMDNSLKKALTPRQMEVLGHLSEGLANKQIAYAMSVSEATVKLHINALLRNLKANNRTQAVILAQKQGLI